MRWSYVLYPVVVSVNTQLFHLDNPRMEREKAWEILSHNGQCLTKNLMSLHMMRSKNGEGEGLGDFVTQNVLYPVVVSVNTQLFNLDNPRISATSWVLYTKFNRK